MRDAGGAPLIGERGRRRAGQADALVGTLEQEYAGIAGEAAAVERRFDNAASELAQDATRARSDLRSKLKKVMVSVFLCISECNAWHPELSFFPIPLNAAVPIVMFNFYKETYHG